MPSPARGWSPTNTASSNSPPAPPHGGVTSAPQVRPTTTSNAAAPRPPRSSRPNGPTKCSSATGSPADQPLTSTGLDDFIRGADDLADLHVVVQERHELRPRRPPQRDDRRVLGAPGLGELGEPGLGRGLGRGGV